VATHEDFLKAILACPDEDAPRLIYADWLEEQGESARASFIRMQCQLARMQKYEPGYFSLVHQVEKLLRDNQQDWSAAIKPLVHFFRFERGFVGDVTARAKQLVHKGETLFSLAPIRRLKLMMFKPADVPALAELTILQRLRTLSLGTNDLTGDEVRQLLSSPHLEQVRVLEFDGYSPNHGNLTFLSPSLLPQVQELQFGQRLPMETWEHVCANPWLAQVKSLRLAGWLESAVRLQGEPKQEDLALFLQSLNPRPIDGLRHLVRSPHLGKLRSLEVNFSCLTDETAEEIAQNEAFSELKQLELKGTILSDRGVSAIAGAKFLPHLESLGLALRHVTSTAHDAGILALAQAPGSGRLRSVSLDNGPNVTETAWMTLVQSPLCSQVTYWNLPYCAQIGDAFARLLLDKYPANSMARLALGGTSISKEMQKTLRKHFGPQVCTFSTT
jgi:uncharacterized protein (TIGR02996 family)